MRLKHRFQIQTRHEMISVALILLTFVLLGVAAPAFPQGKLLPLEVHVCEKAPNFTLLSTSGKMVSLSSFRGYNVLIDFYEGYW